VVTDDRFTPRIDQGERFYSFWVTAGPKHTLLDSIDRTALVCNEQPPALSFYPPGQGATPKPLAVIEDEAVQMPTVKQAEDGHGYIVRLFEPTGRDRQITLKLPVLDLEIALKLGAFEIKTLRIDPQTGAVQEADLIERPLVK